MLDVRVLVKLRAVLRTTAEVMNQRLLCFSLTNGFLQCLDHWLCKLGAIQTGKPK
jgi:hypothetical protein